MTKNPNPPRQAAMELMADRRNFVAALSYLEDDKLHYAVDELYTVSSRMQERGTAGSAMKIEELAYGLEQGDVAEKKARALIEKKIINQIDQVLTMIFVMSGGSVGGPQF